MIAHKRIRIQSGKVEEGSLTYPLSGLSSKAEGWTDIRAVDMPPEAVFRTELVVAKGKTASDILADMVKAYGGDWLVFNAAYFGDDGTLLGKTYKNGEVIFPDVVGKTEHRPYLYRKAGRFGIGRQDGTPAGLDWGVVGVPTLTAGGNAVHPLRTEEKTPSDVFDTNPRMIAGLKADGALGIILVDGRGPYDKGLTCEEACVISAHYGYVDSINLDGGRSATLATNNRQLLDAMEIDKSNKKRQYHVSDMSANYVERPIHHGIAIQFDPEKLFPFYMKNHIPKTTPHNRRPGHKLEATTITIHNTGNPSSTARNERYWLTNPANSVTASYHIVIGPETTAENSRIVAIEGIPLNESAWHAGDGSNGPGNRTSIAIEICESGNYAKTLDKAVELVAAMLKERGWGVERLRRHYDWSGKICPRLMYDAGKWTGWEVFKERVKSAMEPIQEKPVEPFADIKGHWAESDMRKAMADGWLNGYPDGTFRPDEPVIRAELAAVLSRLK